MAHLRATCSPPVLIPSNDVTRSRYVPPAGATHASPAKEPLKSSLPTTVAFVSVRAGGARIFTMNADGSNPVRLTRDDGRADYIPSWSPGGDRIVFMNDATGAELFVINVDGTGLVNISNQPTFEVTGPQAWGP